MDPSIRSIILILLACSSLLILGGLGPSRAQPPLLPHATINIAATAGVGNFTLTAGVTPGGTGTFGNPYVIENWEIITNSSFGIHIKNTHEFFIIRNVFIQATNSTGETEGIYLDNVQNGQVQNADISGFFYGIWLSLGSPNKITSNSIWNNTYGLYMTGSSETISNNHIYKNSKYGAWITSSYNNVFSSNNVSSNGNGRCSPGCDGEGFVVSSSNNNLFFNNTLVANDWYGFRTIFSQSNTYQKNYVAQNQFGIIFTDSSGHQIFENNMTNNDFGVGLEGGNMNSNVTANWITSTNPGSYGIYVTRTLDPMVTTGNTIYNNYILTQTNAFDDWNYTSGIQPDSWNITRRIGTNILGGPFVGGNFYSNYAGSDPDQDGIGNTPFAILGGIGGHNILDQLPLMASQPSVTHDVAVTSVTAQPNSVVDGSSISVTVAVSNLGTSTETFSVNVTYNLQSSSLTTLITTHLISSLSANAATSFTITWTTTGLSAGTYIVKAVSSTVSGETYTANNSCCTPPTAAQTVTLTANQPPTAQFTPSASSSFTGQTVTFDGTASLDPDGTISSYSWDFGDGTTGTGGMPTHSYSTAGTYTVRLTVTDNQGASSTPFTQSLTVSQSSNQPGSPGSFILSATGGKATLTWTAPSNTGGSAIIKYRIYRGASNSSLTWIANTTSTSTTYEDTTVTNGQTYYYQVTAVNEAGVESPRTFSQDVLVPAEGSTSIPPYTTLILGIAGTVAIVAILAAVMILRRRPKPA